jgi:hypothetical protein
MKCICLGYYEEGKWETLSGSEQDALMDACFDYDDVLREKGHFLGGEALEPGPSATTLRRKGGKVSVTDGRQHSWPGRASSALEGHRRLFRGPLRRAGLP